jgi:hypothetical protein
MTRHTRNAARVRPLRRIDSESAETARAQIVDELQVWRQSAVPEAATPLGADDIVRLLRSCMSSLGLDKAIAADFSVNTVHYYRRKDIIDPPNGRTAAARYDIHHFWQVAGARLAGHLGLATLAEARDAVRGADEVAALNFLADRVVDARARNSSRALTMPGRRMGMVASAAPPAAEAALAYRSLPGVVEAPAGSIVAQATVLSLPEGAWCVIPASHSALRSRTAAAQLVEELTAALHSLQIS